MANACRWLLFLFLLVVLSNVVQAGVFYSVPGVNGFPFKKLYDIGKGKPFSCVDGETNIVEKGTVFVGNGSTRFYTGYATPRIKTSNKNPIVARYDGGFRTWCRNDFETDQEIISAGYAIAWDPMNQATEKGLYVVFSITGASSAPEQDFKKFTYPFKGWLKDYGSGENATLSAPVAVVLKLNSLTGEVEGATYISSRGIFAQTRGLEVVSLELDSNNNLALESITGYTPLRTDRTRMVCPLTEGPYKYSVTLSPDLTTALHTSALGCS